MQFENRVSATFFSLQYFSEGLEVKNISGSVHSSRRLVNNNFSKDSEPKTNVRDANQAKTMVISIARDFQSSSTMVVCVGM